MPWKLYIDSRKRVKGSRGDTDSSFAIALPYPITASGKCFIDVCLIPNSFYTIRPDNDRIYLTENTAFTPRVATIAHGQYNVYELRDQIVIALNASKAITGQYACTYLPSTNRYIISIVNGVVGDMFNIWMEENLRQSGNQWMGVINMTAEDTNSANRACGFSDGTTMDGTDVISATAPNAPDVQPYKQLFLRSNLGGGSAESLGVNFETDIIRRIVIGNTPMNALVHDVHASLLDAVTINGKPEMNSLWFELIDTDGKLVDTHGLPISFSIIFESIE